MHDRRFFYLGAIPARTPLVIFLKLIQFLFIIAVMVGHMCTKGNFVELVLSFNLYVGSRDYSWVTGLFSKCLYQLSHFASPSLH